MRYFIHLCYDGTAYHGWQRQPNANTIQQTIEQALETILRQPTAITAAGRTDTGVHAAAMAAHFDHPTPLNTDKLAHRLNCLLPPDIGIHNIRCVSEQMHARFSAQRRTYHYHVHYGKQPLLRHYSWQQHQKLDIKSMNQAAELLMQYTDFTSFSKTNNNQKTNLCHIYSAQWEDIGEQRLRFSITANRFLRNMVRAIVGTLIQVGQHRITPQHITDIIAKKDRCAAADSVPAHGLSLVDIQYPE